MKRREDASKGARDSFGEEPMLSPQSKRSKKGRSGNPAGRPKKLDFGVGNGRSAGALALREADESLHYSETVQWGPEDIASS